MAYMNINDYLHKVESAQYAQKGDVLAKLLSFRDPHVMSSRLAIERPERLVENAISPPFDEIVAAHLRTIWAVEKGDNVEAWKSQTLAVSAVAKMLTEIKEENWMLPVMNVTVLDLRIFAITADKIQSKASITQPGEVLEKASETLMSCFRVCVADMRSSENCSKRWGLLYLVNQFLKIYFKINKLNLCKPMIRAIEAVQFKDKYPLSQLTTYKYYTGRKSMFDSEFKAADEALSFAFQHCHRSSKKNKRRILLYLLPVKISLEKQCLGDIMKGSCMSTFRHGYLPKERLLKKYNLPEFIDIRKGVKDGNVSLLNEAFRKYESFFIGSGIYLILEKLKTIAYRNLFKKVFLIQGTHKIDIAVFHQALEWMNIDSTGLDETECILANMIYEGKIKGYISHSHRKLVVSKVDPFPSLLVG